MIRAAWEDRTTSLNASFILVLNLRRIPLSRLCDFSQTLSVALGRGGGGGWDEVSRCLGIPDKCGYGKEEEEKKGSWSGSGC